MMDTQRRAWNQSQKELRQALQQPEQLAEAIELFLQQHAAVHSAKISSQEILSFVDAVLEDITELQMRRIPQNHEHSIAWCFWHMARIEDVTMNLLVGGRPQVLHSDTWLGQLRVTTEDTGNDMEAPEVADLSASIDAGALQAYRLAVGRRTQEIVSQITADSLKQRVDPSRLQLIVDQGAVAAGSGLLAYWGRRTIAGLLLMPPTRHNMVHLNEALEIKRSV